MNKTVDYKYLAAASLGAGAVLAFHKAKNIFIENHLLRAQLARQAQFIAEEEEAKRQFLGQLNRQVELPERSESFGFARALSDS